MKSMCGRWPVLSMLLLAACAAQTGEQRGDARAGKERSDLRIENPISAYGAWVREGGSLRTGAKDITFVGTLVAQLYMQTRDSSAVFGPVSFGLLPFGSMVCPAIVKIDGNGSQSGFGSCTITTPDEGQIFANIACTSLRPGECRGSFAVTGGTDRFRKVSGGGPLVIMPASRDITLMNAGSGEHPLPRSQDCAVRAQPNAPGSFTKASAAGQGGAACPARSPAFRAPGA